MELRRCGTEPLNHSQLCLHSVPLLCLVWRSASHLTFSALPSLGFFALSASVVDTARPSIDFLCSLRMHCEGPDYSQMTLFTLPRYFAILRSQGTYPRHLRQALDREPEVLQESARPTYLPETAKRIYISLAPIGRPRLSHGRCKWKAGGASIDRCRLLCTQSNFR
jgi:hypothetical protein